MLELIKSYDRFGNLLGGITEFSNVHITESLSTPNQVEFEMIEFDDQVVELGGLLEIEDELYRITEINKSVDTNITTIYGITDVTTLKGKYFHKFDFGKRNLMVNGLITAVQSAGWVITPKETFTKTRTFYTEKKNLYEIILEVAEKFNYEVKFSAKYKTISVYSKVGRQSGFRLALEGYNLEQFEQNADLNAVENVIYGYGKDGLRFKGLCADEKKYYDLDDYSVGFRAVGIYEDTEEDSSDSLRYACEEYLAKSRYPTYEYVATALDLKSIDDSAPSIYDIRLGDNVTSYTDKFGKIDLRVMQIDRYPNAPWLTRISLSNKVQKPIVSREVKKEIATNSRPIETKLREFSAVKSNEEGWITQNSEGMITASKRWIETVTVSPRDDYFLSPYERRMLPFPMSTAVFSGSTDGWLGQLVNTSVANQTFARYRFAFYDKDVATKTNPYVLSLANSVTITGQRAVPPDAPTVASKSKRSQAIEVAESYYRKRANNSRSFGYGGNFITYANSNVVNDPYGNAMMECDTFVCLVLMGIKYEDSPYTDTSPSATYNFADLRYNPHSYTWTLPLKNDDPNYILTDDVKMWDLSTRKITYTGLMNFLFWTKHMVFKNQAQAEAGDVVIFTEPDGKYFDGITHIGIVDKVDGELWIYHVTYYTDGHLEHEPLSEVLNRVDYPRGGMYFARIDYA